MEAKHMYVQLVEDLEKNQPARDLLSRQAAQEIAALKEQQELPPNYVAEHYPEFHAQLREHIDKPHHVRWFERSKENLQDALAILVRWFERSKENLQDALAILGAGIIFQLLWRWIMTPVMKKGAAND